MELSIGEIDCSSKSLNEKYGMKGQALSAIRLLSTTIEIYSKVLEQGDISYKRMTDDGQSQLLSLPSLNMPNFSKGTIVKVKGLFDRFPVRRAAVRDNIELVLIQDFINHMSVLHHKIAWSFVDACANRIVFSLQGSPSVSKRLLALHSDIILTKLHSLAYTDGVYSIEGLLSYPCKSNCSTTKDCQYMFIDYRWMRNRDIICKFINDSFGKYLAGSSNHGPSAKHVKTDQARFPNFVIHFICPHNELDIFVEPDKTVSIFSSSEKVLQFVRKALTSFALHRFPEFVDFLTEGTHSSHISWRNIASSNPDTLKQILDHQRSFSKYFSCPHYEDAPLQESADKLFSEAFMFNDREHEESSSFQKCDYNSPPSASIPTEHVLLKKVSISHKSSWKSREVKLNRRNDIKKCPLPKQHKSKQTIYDGNILANNGVVQYHSLRNDGSFQNDDCKVSSFSMSIDFMDRFEQVAQHISSDRSKYSSSAISRKFTEEVTIDKEMLRQMVVIGQLDEKFILCRAASIVHNGKIVLFALDQHAVEERINYEARLNGLTHSVRSIPLSDVAITITPTEREIYYQYMQVFNEWCFDFQFSKDDKRVFIYSVPEVLGECLTAEDCQEFNHFIFHNMKIPPKCWIPPAVLRIAASQACRSSVKFGTTLTKDRMDSLISSLSDVTKPFTCAHGRPSIVPLMQFSLPNMHFNK